MKINKIYMIAALLGIALTGCQKVSEEFKPFEGSVDGTTMTLTVQVSKAFDTKALSLDGSTLDASWAEGEKVNVFYGGTCIGTLSVQSVSDSKATLSGEVTGVSGLAVNSYLTLLFPGRNDKAWTYVGQDGSAPSTSGTMATGYDYAVSTLKVSEIDLSSDPKTISATVQSAFENQQSIYSFGFRIGDKDGTAVAVKSFTVSSNKNKIVSERNYVTSDWVSTYGAVTVTPSSASSEPLYMALRNENMTEADTYTFTVVNSENVLYTGTKVIPVTSNETAVLGYGKFVSAKKVVVNPVAFAPAPTGSVDGTTVEVL